MLKRIVSLVLLFILGVAVASIQPPQVARAATFDVNDTSMDPDATPLGDGTCDIDLGTAGDQCSLRAAIDEANANAEADTITLSVAGPYTINTALYSDGTYGDSALPLIDTEIIIQGNGATIERAAAAVTDFRIFHVTGGGNLTLDNVTVTGGYAVDGGGVLVEGNGTLTVRNGSVVDNNEATGYGGGLYVTDTNSSIIITGSVVSNNIGGYGGGIYSWSGLSITGSTISGNTAPITGWTADAAGIGIGSGNTYIADTVIENNIAADDGGGLYCDGGVLTLGDNVTFSGNRADGPGGNGGGMYLDVPCTIGADVGANFTVTNNYSGQYGGGIYNRNVAVNINGATFTTNDSGLRAGAIYVDGDMIIDNTQFSGNTADNTGGTLLTNDDLVLRNSLITGGVTAELGGAIRRIRGDLIIENTTISGNAAGWRGGGISSTEGPSVVEEIRLFNVTITNNTVTGSAADYGGAGIALADDGGTAGAAPILYTRNTIIAGNTDNSGNNRPDCILLDTSDIISEGYNLIGDENGCTGEFDAPSDIVGGVAGLGPLADNGGPTQTHALQVTSDALDGGDPAGCQDSGGTTFTADQRGEPRPVDGNADATDQCDIGAFEAIPAVATSPTLGGTVLAGWNVNVGQTGTQTINLQNSGDGILGITNPQITGANAASFSLVGTLPPYAINSGGSATATIQCAPSSAGALTATLTFDTNDPANPTITYTLTCMGNAVAASGGGGGGGGNVWVPPQEVGPSGAGNIDPYVERLNLRPFPTGSPYERLGVDVIAYMYEGDTVEVYPTTPQCVGGFTWYHVRLVARADGTPVENPPEGWAAGKIKEKLTIIGTLPANPCCNLNITENAGDIIFRAVDGPEGDLYGLEPLASLTAIGRQPGWWLVHIDWFFWEPINRQGWVLSEAVVAEGACESVPVVGE